MGRTSCLILDFQMCIRDSYSRPSYNRDNGDRAYRPRFNSENGDRPQRPYNSDRPYRPRFNPGADNGDRPQRPRYNLSLIHICLAAQNGLDSLGHHAPAIVQVTVDGRRCV